MSILDEITSAFMRSNSIFSDLDEFGRFQANDTQKNVEHIFHVSIPEGVTDIDERIFFAVNLNINVTYLHIEEFIKKALGHLYDPSWSSALLLLQDGFPLGELHDDKHYLIDISSVAAKKKSIQGFIDKYYQWLEPIRKKMRSPECLIDFEFHLNPECEPIYWEIRRLTYLFLHEKATLKPYLENLKEQFFPFVKEIEADEARLKAKDIDSFSDEDHMENWEIFIAKKAIEEMKKMLAAVENDKWCSG